MNKVILVGRLTGEPNVRYTQSENPLCVARYNLAVARMKKDEADFISCVAMGKAGEFAENYLHKGTKIAITGRIQTGSYTNRDGVKVYTTDVFVEEHEFVESRQQTAAPQTQQPQTRQPQGQQRQQGAQARRQQPQAQDDFVRVPDDLDDLELPFR